MSSISAVYLSSYVGKEGDRDPTSHSEQQSQSWAPSYLSPNSSAFLTSNSTSPTVNDTNTPGDSVSVLSVNYQSSDFSDLGDDPFQHIDFDAVEGASPSFLVTDHLNAIGDDQGPSTSLDQSGDAVQAGLYQPISPGHTPSHDIEAPYGGHQGLRSSQIDHHSSSSVSPRDLSKPFNEPTAPAELGNRPTYTFTPSASNSNSRHSSNGDITVEAVPVISVMSGKSPHVTVTVWSQDNEGLAPVTAPDSNLYGSDQLEVSSHVAATSSVRDAEGRWVREDTFVPTGGLDPEHRPQGDLAATINEAAADRELEDRNREVSKWLKSSTGGLPTETTTEGQPSDAHDGISPTEIPLGDATENKLLPGQTYFLEKGGEITVEDLEIMRQNRAFADAPVLAKIHQTDPEHGHQPSTSQAAAEMYQRLCRDMDTLSRSATWGTRRRSFPFSTLDAESEAVLSGNFLRKLNIGSSESNRRPSIFSRAYKGLKRQTSGAKRLRSPLGEVDDQQLQQNGERRDSRDSLSPTTQTASGRGGGKKQSFPSINTAFVNMSASVAAVGSTAHVRNGSISATPAVTSPKSPSTLSLGVKNMLRRPRSGSELTNMWKKTGGPPVPSLVKTTSAPSVQPQAAAPEQDEDEDEAEDMYDDAEEKGEAVHFVGDMEPTTAGFKDHVLKLNPMLRTENTWLVDRIVYHQVARYKNLLNAKIKHLNAITNRQCACGTLCMALNGNSCRGLRPPTGYHDGSDGDHTPLEGSIGKESFPPDIPMPPARALPAEFECPLCFQARKFNKPSDWTKHVHEDVQPFTCTWVGCREPKMFKRKADWVRHENEGHRHLEWWVCNVDDCKHKCFRRDNFIQHLVREHKYIEPTIKTKAAIKRAGGMDATLQKVEECHADTMQTSYDEPCRFCGRTFPSWKKLTVHLAKHMEQISLPVLRLVERKTVETDTIISPIQDPPAQPFQSTAAQGVQYQHRYAQPGNIKMEHNPYNSNPGQSASLNHQLQHGLSYQNVQQHAFFPAAPSGLPITQMAQPPHFQQPNYYNNNQTLPQQYENIGQTLSGQTDNLSVSVAFNNTTTQAYAAMPVTSGPPYMAPGIAAPNPFITLASDTEPFPAFDSLGLHGMQDQPNGLPYVDVMDQPGDTYTPHGSHRASPFLPSPHQGQGQFFAQ